MGSGYLVSPLMLVVSTLFDLYILLVLLRFLLQNPAPQMAPTVDPEKGAREAMFPPSKGAPRWRQTSAPWREFPGSGPRRPTR